MYLFYSYLGPKTLPPPVEAGATFPLIKDMAKRASAGGSNDALGDRIWLLLDQARILEGDAVLDPNAFARRLASVLEIGIG